MTAEFRAGPALTPRAYEELVGKAVFACCRWNLTEYDTPSLCRFPILVSQETFAGLSRLSERLADEVLAAERELLARPDLHSSLGLPPRIAKALQIPQLPSKAPRVLRIDFHCTPSGWRITEANSDVAGGFIEGSGVSALWPEGSGRPVGDPAGELASVFSARYGRGATVGFLHLASYTEDRQVVTYLSRRFEEQGLRAVLFDAAQLRPGLRALQGPDEIRLDGLFRFFPGEWLERLPVETAWPELIASSVVCNPLSAMLTQSKRFPLIWPELKTPLPTWRELMPETCPVKAFAEAPGDLVLKPAFGHEGFGVSIPGVSDDSLDRAARARARRSPKRWVAQRRFDFSAIETPDGPRHVCLGVYVVDGRAAGGYARVSKRPLIDDCAQDAVILKEGG